MVFSIILGVGKRLFPDQMNAAVKPSQLDSRGDGSEPASLNQVARVGLDNAEHEQSMTDRQVTCVRQAADLRTVQTMMVSTSAARRFG